MFLEVQEWTVEVGGMEVDRNEWKGCFNTFQFPVPMGRGRV